MRFSTTTVPSRRRRYLLLRCRTPSEMMQLGDVADLGNLDDLANLGVAEDLVLLGRREHPGEGLFDVVGDLVDDAVEADVDAAGLGYFAGGFVGHDGEPDDDRVGGIRQKHVAFADAADGGVGAGEP